MKVQYCSDLHLEFPENNSYVNKNYLKPEGEILLLAGDILPFSLDHKKFSFFDFIADNFEAIYWIPGNHEYYGFDIGNSKNPMLEKIRSNVFLVNNHTIQYKDVNILCSTLWSHINHENEWVIQKNLADFSFITINGQTLLASHINALHQLGLSYIKTEVTKFALSKNIVLTHHVPTLYNYPPKFKKSILKDAFAIELHDFIYSSNIGFWVYGHHHHNIAPFSIGNTELLTNQLGYVRKHEHGSYKRNAVFEI